MGEKSYNLLDFRAHQLGKRQDEQVILWVQHELKKLAGEQEKEYSKSACPAGTRLKGSRKG